MDCLWFRQNKIANVQNSELSKRIHLLEYFTLQKAEMRIPHMQKKSFKVGKNIFNSKSVSFYLFTANMLG